MMVYYITYSNDLYAKTRDFSAKMAKKFGKFDKIIVYKPEDIDKEFYEKHKNILEQTAGNGLWLWKPYFVLKALKDVKDGDIIFYADAGSFFFRNCKPLIKSMDDDIWISDIPLIEKQFTKPELFEMMGCKDICFTDTNQVQANFIAVRKTQRGIEFVKEWLNYCSKDEALTRETIALDNDKDFLGHRSDQSVLSLLAKKWGIESHRDPSQYGNLPIKYYVNGRLFNIPVHDDKYKPCIILHRQKRPTLQVCLNQWLCAVLPYGLLKIMRNVKNRKWVI